MSPMSAFRFTSRAFMKKLLVAGAVLALAVTASAQTAAKSQNNSKDESTQLTAVDKTSGKLRQPTKEEAADLAASFTVNQSTEGLKVTQRADGTSIIDFDGRFESSVIAKKNSDGSISRTCVTTPEEVKDFMNTLKASKDDHSHDSTEAQNIQSAPALEEK
jgi:hypothetical protein